MSESVLVLDGNQRSALAVTRSLGRNGLRVLVAEQKQPSMASCSRYCAESFQYPSPYDQPDNFIKALAAECRLRDVGVIYPMTDITMYHILKNRSAFAPAVVPFGPFEAYEHLSDKWRLFKLADELGISKPQTLFIESKSALENVRHELRFPLVIKPYRSLMFLNGQWVKAGVQYADSFDELLSTVKSFDYLDQRPFLLQEYILGENQGLFVLCDHGRPLIYFSNRRLRDKPPSGGVVTLAESIPINPKTRAMAAKLFSHVGWHGAAMLECMVKDGIPYMLEVNARFWASTQSSVDCGVDFPWLVYQLATGAAIDDVPSYKEAVQLRWLAGDLIHLYMHVRGKDLNRYQSEEQRRRALNGFWKFWDRRTRYEINRWGDLKPFLWELGHYTGIAHLGRVAQTRISRNNPLLSECIDRRHGGHPFGDMVDTLD